MLWEKKGFKSWKRSNVDSVDDDFLGDFFDRHTQPWWTCAKVTHPQRHHPRGNIYHVMLPLIHLVTRERFGASKK